MTRRTHTVPHSSHWGVFEAEVADGTVVAVHPYAHDPDPSPMLGNIPGAVRHPARIAEPMVRAGWLERGPGADARRGAEAVYGGSYGWSSAGRFHHAQSQLHRFLNALGGYVRSVGSYSHGALDVVLERVLGSERLALDHATSWSVLARETELFVLFGGVP